MCGLELHPDRSCFVGLQLNITEATIYIMWYMGRLALKSMMGRDTDHYFFFDTDQYLQNFLEANDYQRKLGTCREHSPPNSVFLQRSDPRHCRATSATFPWLEGKCEEMGGRDGTHHLKHLGDCRLGGGWSCRGQTQWLLCTCPAKPQEQVHVMGGLELQVTEKSWGGGMSMRFPSQS